VSNPAGVQDGFRLRSIVSAAQRLTGLPVWFADGVGATVADLRMTCLELLDRARVEVVVLEGLGTLDRGLLGDLEQLAFELRTVIVPVVHLEAAMAGGGSQRWGPGSLPLRDGSAEIFLSVSKAEPESREVAEVAVQLHRKGAGPGVVVRAALFRASPLLAELERQGA
jgi:hypothetical protein